VDISGLVEWISNELWIETTWGSLPETNLCGYVFEMYKISVTCEVFFFSSAPSEQ